MWGRISQFAAAVIAGLLLVGAIILAVHAHHGHDTRSTSQPTRAPSTPVVTTRDSPPADPPGLVRSRRQLNDRVRAFSALYFSLSPAKSADEIRQAVTPYATQHFLQTAPFGFGSSEADQAMLQEGASLRVTATSDLVTQLTDAPTVTGSVTLHVVKYDADGNVVTSFNYQQPMTWVIQGKTWFIDAAPRT